MSALEIAAATQTSDATVVRAARSLGFANLREMRNFLSNLEEQVSMSVGLEAAIRSAESSYDVLIQAVDRQTADLDALLRRISETEFNAAVNLLSSSPRVWWSGIGPSSFLAEYATFLGRRLGLTSHALTHAGTDHADELLSINSGDAVVVLSYGRVHPHVRVLTKHCDNVGAKVVLISDSSMQLGSAFRGVRLNPGRGLVGYFATHAVTMVLIESILLAIASQNPARAAESVDLLNSLRQLIAGKRIDVDVDH